MALITEMELILLLILIETGAFIILILVMIFMVQEIRQGDRIKIIIEMQIIDLQHHVVLLTIYLIQRLLMVEQFFGKKARIICISCKRELLRDENEKNTYTIIFDAVKCTDFCFCRYKFTLFI